MSQTKKVRCLAETHPTRVILVQHWQGVICILQICFGTRRDVLIGAVYVLIGDNTRKVTAGARGSLFNMLL